MRQLLIQNLDLVKRIFYGLKQNERPFFKKSNTDETSFYSITVDGENESENGKYESESIIIKHSSTQIEYYLSISKLNCYAELVNFETNKLYYKRSKEFANWKDVKSLRHSIFPYSPNNSGNDYYYMFCFVGGNNSDENKQLFFQKHIFKGNYFPSENTCCELEYIEDNGFGKIISCFQSESEFIICLFMTKDNNKIYLNFVGYEKEFNKNHVFKLLLTYNDENIFLKCIHLMGDVGIFAYYFYINETLYPVLAFKEFNNSTNAFESFYLIPILILQLLWINIF